MSHENKRRFYIDFDTMKMIYPCEISKKISNFGVLEPYRNQTYTLKEINEVLAEIIKKGPFISNSMNIHIDVMSYRDVVRDMENVREISYHHLLDIKNYEYKSQKRTEHPEIVWSDE